MLNLGSVLQNADVPNTNPTIARKNFTGYNWSVSENNLIVYGGGSMICRLRHLKMWSVFTEKFEIALCFVPFLL